MELKEVWKPVADTEGYYEVSCFGNVRSTDRVVNNRRYTSKLLRLQIHSAGYRVVSISVKGVVVSSLVHVLVAQAFIANPEAKREVNHKDGNKSNNAVGNLEWVTHSENIQHSYDTLGQSKAGRIAGESHYNCKFSDSEIACIRAKKGSASTRKVAAEHNTSSSHISLIWNNKTRASHERVTI